MPTNSQSTTAHRFAPFGTTIFSEMTALAHKHNAVNLSQGFPDFDGPEMGKAAAIQAIHDGHNQYAPMAGMPMLREAIASWASRCTKIDVDPDTEITVTSGCTQAIASTMLGLLNPGDEVIIFEPYYDSYRPCLAMADAKAVFVTLHPTETGFAYRSDELSKAFSDHTKAIVINTPHNPTGIVFTLSQLEEIAKLCVKHDTIAISDEVYERLIYPDSEQSHCSIATMPGMRDRTIVLSSSGKTFSLTGWKVGWAIAPPHLTSGIRSAHQFLTFSVPTPLQFGIAELLKNGDDEVEKLLSHYTHTRSLLGEALAELGFGIKLPAGSYFIMADHTNVSDRLGLKNDVELCRWLPANAGVAAIPPSAFYANPTHGASFVRFTFCKETKTIDQAIARLQNALKN